MMRFFTRCLLVPALSVSLLHADEPQARKEERVTEDGHLLDAQGAAFTPTVDGKRLDEIEQIGKPVTLTIEPQKIDPVIPPK